MLEKFNEKKYRKDLADDIKGTEDHKERRAILESERDSSRYQNAEELHKGEQQVYRVEYAKSEVRRLQDKVVHLTSKIDKLEKGRAEIEKDRQVVKERKERGDFRYIDTHPRANVSMREILSEGQPIEVGVEPNISMERIKQSKVIHFVPNEIGDFFSSQKTYEESDAQGTGKINKVMRVISLDRDSIDSQLMRMNNKAWQPATVEDLVAFCEDNSNIGSQRDIIALGSVVRRHEYMLGPDDLHLTADNFYSPVAYKMKGSEEKEPKIGITTTRIDGYRSLNGYLGVQDNLYFLVIDVEETTKLELERTRKELDERKRILESLMPNTDTGEK